MEQGSTQKRPVTTTETSFEILEHLMENGPTPLGDVAGELGLAKSTVHRHLLTLKEHGFVVREGNSFKVGLRSFEFGSFAKNQLPFFEIGREKADLLADDLGEKVRLTTEENGFSVVLYRSMGDHPIQATAQVGSYQHLHVLAAGKAILAELSDEDVDTIVDRHGLPRRTEQTITDRTELFEELEQIRSRGYAYNIGESIPNLHAIGAAFCDEDGNPLGALSISGGGRRLQGRYIEDELPDVLLGVIDEIEINLNYQ